MRTPPEPFEQGSAEAQGELLFATNCKTCHTNDSWRQDAYALEIQQQDSRWATWLDDIENSRIVSAPNVTHYGQRHFLAAGIKENTRENLIKWINDPSEIKIGTSMQAHAAVYQDRARQQDQPLARGSRKHRRLLAGIGAGRHNAVDRSGDNW